MLGRNRAKRKPEGYLKDANKTFLAFIPHAFQLAVIVDATPCCINKRSIKIMGHDAASTYSDRTGPKVFCGKQKSLEQQGPLAHSQQTKPFFLDSFILLLK